MPERSKLLLGPFIICRELPSVAGMACSYPIKEGAVNHRLFNAGDAVDLASTVTVGQAGVDLCNRTDVCVYVLCMHKYRYAVPLVWDVFARYLCTGCCWATF